mgnify:CR=1 FL=1
MSGIPEKMPDVGRSTLRPFNSLEKFFEFFKGQTPDDTPITGGKGNYEELLAETWRHIEDEIKNGNVQWYGEPMPTSLEDALARERYQLMDEYNDVYKNIIKPRVQELIKNSKGKFDMPVLKYNDRNLGVFDFNRASAGLQPQYKYYSIKKKEFVEASAVKTVKDGAKYKYILIKDGSAVVLVPKIKSTDKDLIHKAYQEIYDGGNVFEVLKKNGLKIGGSADAFTSTIKKSYVLKEITPKPKNAIRLFVKIGCSCGYTAKQYKWTGYAAIGIAQLLSTLGYAVSIIGVYGVGTSINIDGNLYNGVRYYGINLKKFEETIDSSSILYTLSDATFFRVRFFDCIVKSSFYYKDFMDSSLGYPADIGKIKKMVFAEYGRRDELFKSNGERNNNSQFLYYFVGDIYNEQDLSTAILDIGLNVVNENQAAAAAI